jgi:hypothetical protein
VNGPLVWCLSLFSLFHSEFQSRRLLTCKTRPELKRLLKIMFVIILPLSGTSVRVQRYGPDRHLICNPFNSVISFK